MAELIWTEPALLDLDAVADYIELDNPPAARRYVHHVFTKTAHLKKFPELGTAIPELDGLPMYRQLVLPPAASSTKSRTTVSSSCTSCGANSFCAWKSCLTP